jgi:hypothetical protein
LPFCFNLAEKKGENAKKAKMGDFERALRAALSRPSVAGNSTREGDPIPGLKRPRRPGKVPLLSIPHRAYVFTHA